MVKAMRIVSQDGCYDLPYEQTVVLREETHILVRTMEYEDLRIASYSTEEKAIKAMEMCRHEYGKVFSFKGGVIPITGVMTQSVLFTYPKLFQFPKEEEVEDE